MQRFADGHDEHVRAIRLTSVFCDRNSRTPQLLCRYFLINSVFECIDDNLLTRVCDLKLGKTTLLLFASATTSVAMFAFKIAHIQVWTRALRSGVCARARQVRARRCINRSIDTRARIWCARVRVHPHMRQVMQERMAHSDRLVAERTALLASLEESMGHEVPV